MIFVLKRGTIKKEKNAGGIRTVTGFWAFVAGVRGSWVEDEDRAVQKMLFYSVFHFPTNTCKFKAIGTGFVVKFARRGSGGWTKGVKKYEKMPLKHSE